MTLAPLDAVAFLSLLARSDGIQESRWALKDGSRVTTLEYYPFDRRSEGMGAGPTLLQQVWDMLDVEVDLIYSERIEFKDYHKHRARMIAEVLALFMPPHFRTPDEVAREGIKRYKAREAGDDRYETAGLGSRAFEPPPAAVAAAAEFRTSSRTPAKRSAPKPSGKSVPDSALPAVKQALETGMFTVAQIAKTYGMTEDEVKAQFSIAS